jgi:hypothetical protein
MSRFVGFGELLIIITVLLVASPHLFSVIVPGALPALDFLFGFLHVSFWTELELIGIGILFIIMGIAIGQASKPRARMVGQ